MARRFKLASAFNMIGLIVAFATFYLFMPQIIYQLTYNHSINDYERLYRMESNYLYDEVAYSDNVCRAFTDALDQMPGVESYSLASNINYISKFYQLKFRKGQGDTTLTFTQGNNTVVSTLTNRCVDGSIEWNDTSTTGHDGLIIPASIAKKYFGTTHAAGKEMIYEDEQGDTMPFAVRGVFEDFAVNSDGWNCIYSHIGSNDSLTFNCRYKCIVKFNQFPDDFQAWSDSLKQVILSMIVKAPDALSNPQRLEEDMRLVMATKFKFTPLKDTYFENNSFTTGEIGYMSLLVILMTTALVIIILATINFVNFTLAESPMRVRGINTRMVLGADRHSLRKGLVAENIIVSVTACLIAIVVCKLLLKFGLISSLMTHGYNTTTDYLILIPTMLVIALAMGLIGGIYPARFVTSFPPAMVLKRTVGLTPQGRKILTGLVGVQLFISFFMVSYISILFLQRDYIIHSNYGFEKGRLLVSSLPMYTNDSTKRVLRQQLMLNPSIVNVSYSDTLLGLTDSQNVNKFSLQDNLTSYRYLLTDTNFVRTMGLIIVEGRDFIKDDSTVVIINTTARQQWKWLKLGDKIPVSFENADSATIVGVCKDFQYATAHISNDKPFIFIIADEVSYYYNCGMINILLAHNADKEKAKQHINKVLEQMFENEAVSVTTFADKLNETYVKEFRYFEIFKYLTIICLLINLIGVFCITLFETEYRRKEIGIRKVAGATTAEIVWMLCRRYGWLILICFALSIPVTLLCGKMTLDYFFMHASITWWIFPLSLIIVSAIMLGTMALQGWRKARENPATSLNAE